MITHEDYKLAVNGYIELVKVSVKQEKSLKHTTNIATMLNYGKQQETLEAKYEALVKDVARYFELYEQAREKWGNGIDDVEAHEFASLHIKLSKVGKEK